MLQDLQLPVCNVMLHAGLQLVHVCRLKKTPQQAVTLSLKIKKLLGSDAEGYCRPAAQGECLDLRLARGIFPLRVAGLRGR